MNTKKVLQLLSERDITQRDLAKKVGVSEAFMSYILKGYKTPSIMVLKRMAECLCVTVDELI